jgi:hypothetical protein
MKNPLSKSFYTWSESSLIKDELSISTSGLSKRGMLDIRVQVHSNDLIQEAESFLRFVLGYIHQNNTKINPGETMNYGYWLVKFEAANDNLLDVWEYSANATEFVPGGNLALRYWRDQHEVCGKFDAAFCPPRPDKLTLISKGVIEGLPIQAVRYHWATHLSGWLIVTEKYEGNTDSLTSHHTYHLTATRPELARYLALPVGFRIDLTQGERIWLDPEVAEDLYEGET